MLRFLFTIAITTMLNILPIEAQEAAPSDLQTLIDLALRNNPQLQSAHKAMQANEARIPVAGALPDPTLGIALMNVPWDNPVFDREAMSGKQISLMQKFPFPGKLRLKSQIVRQQTAVFKARYDEFKNQLIKNVKQIYYNLYYIDQAIETTRKNQALLKEFVKIATMKYSVGKGLQQDVLKAQVEWARLSDQLLILSQKRTTLVARLNRLLNRPVTTSVPSAILPQIKPLPLKLTYLRTQLRRNRPLLAGWQSQIQKQEKAVRLAKKNFWPDFAVSLAYTQRDRLFNGLGGQDFISLGLNFNLPVFWKNKQDKQLESAVFAREQTESAFQNVLNQELENLQSTFSAWQRTIQQEELYRTAIVPQARQSLEAARAGYQNDKVDFLTLINNQLTLFKIELEYQRVISDYFKNLAELEYLIGGPVQSDKE